MLGPGSIGFPLPGTVILHTQFTYRSGHGHGGAETRAAGGQSPSDSDYLTTLSLTPPLKGEFGCMNGISCLT